MIRTCDGTDPNLTMAIPAQAYNPEAHTVSPSWNAIAHPGTVVIACPCGARFDDVRHSVLWPHLPVGFGL
jgi:hypothetical protein